MTQQTEKKLLLHQILPGDQSKWVPPDPIPNSEVKPFSANDSVDYHAKVGHCQALILKAPTEKSAGAFFMPLSSRKREATFCHPGKAAGFIRDLRQVYSCLKRSCILKKNCRTAARPRYPVSLISIVNNAKAREQVAVRVKEGGAVPTSTIY